MSIFPIAPSEAILIGRCLEYFLQAHEDFDSNSFIDSVEYCVRPFVPDLNDGKTLADLLIEYASGGLSLSQFQRAQYSLAPKEDFSENVIEFLDRAAEKYPEKYQHAPLFYRESDDARKIKNRIVALISHNEFDEEFEFGRHVGRVEAESFRCEFWANDWYFNPEDHIYLEDIGVIWKPGDPMEFSARCEASLEFIIGEGLRSKGNYSSILLERLRDGKLYFKLNEDSQCMNQVRSSLFVVLGEVCVLNREFDSKFFEENQKSALPRTLMNVTPSSTGDRIRGQLEMLESQLSERAADNTPPAVLINSVIHGVESMARRLWGTSQTEKKGWFKEIISSKSHRGTNLEKSFAKLAKSLHDDYRNTASHDIDQMKCSRNDVHFVLGAFRKLLTISEKIVNEQNGSRS